MLEVMTAVYEKGMLRPLGPVPLREYQTVRLQILPEPSDDEAEQILQKLANTGILTPPTGYSGEMPLSEKERLELADRLGRAPGKPFSDIIIEDRGAW
jgi:predicted DNA-binding antitoxin AbrB/MazE fold protein